MNIKRQEVLTPIRIFIETVSNLKASLKALHPLPSTLHPPPSTLHPLPSTLHLPPSTFHPPPSTFHPPPSTLHLPPSTFYLLPSTQSFYVFFNTIIDSPNFPNFCRHIRALCFSFIFWSGIAVAVVAHFRH
ncbi:MAG: hypothetical protein KF734_17830 [Saprospiraceae bacterium]|nr:hypothetical protein [Saprospiraceae bacterium]